MANGLFRAYKGQMTGDAAITGFSNVNWEADNIKVYLIDTADDTINLQTDQDILDINAPAIVSTASITGVTSNGVGPLQVINGASTTFTAVSGDQSEALLLWKDSGTPASSMLLVYFDTGVTGLPVIPNGGDITIQWNASGIWAL